jgi:hypothetical protein
LNLVDYSKVSNPDALNRWAGNRLLALPFLSAVLGVVALKRPELVIALFIAFMASVVAVTAWIAGGVSKFQRP